MAMMAVRSSGTTAFEPRAAPAAVWTTSAIVAATVAPTSARPLETRARAAADARGISGIVIAIGRTLPRSASFAGQKTDFFLSERRFHSVFAGAGFNRFSFPMLGFGDFWHAKSSGVLRAFVSCFGLRFRKADFFTLFGFLGFFFREFGFRSGEDLLRFRLFSFCRSCFHLVLFEYGAAAKGVSFSPFLGLFVFRFDQSGSQRDSLVFA